MLIRGITKSDFDYIVSVLDRWWGGPSSERAHPVFFYELGSHALIAEDDGEVVGFLLGFITEEEPRVAYIHLVGIHPEHRRLGVGKELYTRFSERAQAAGAAALKAITTVGNEGSARFHEALGFAVREEADYAGRGRSRVVFTKDL
ncbi:MAG: GNAT family N-acetyltransferase [Sandaracinaceae bacterium]|nr:GNAT family N-acetyltransferase [Sandaracinaceae bacterium]